MSLIGSIIAKYNIYFHWEIYLNRDYILEEMKSSFVLDIDACT